MLIRSFSSSYSKKLPTIVTLGNFDGVHLGHQALLKNLVSIGQQQDLIPTVVTFEPSPQEFFMGDNAPSRLMTLREKYSLLRELGVIQIVCIRFNNAFASISAEQFIENILVERLQTRHMLIGDDFRFGKNRVGDYSLLKSVGSKSNFKVQKWATVCYGEHRVSSSLIRTALQQGDLALAESIMGRPYSISGKVFYGDQRGRQWGFPTANIVLRHGKLPLRGVFLVTATDSTGTQWDGVANVGNRPTVNGQRNQLEAHLFDCNENLYGRRLHITFKKKLRDEQKFSGVDELKNQIEADIQQAKNLLY